MGAHTAFPPLNALRAFEAVVRLGSFRDAADELSVTPSAVSHRVRGLEAYLDTELVRRTPTGVHLTEAGARLYPGLKVAFGYMSGAVANFHLAHEACCQPLATETDDEHDAVPAAWGLQSVGQ